MGSGEHATERGHGIEPRLLGYADERQMGGGEQVFGMADTITVDVIIEGLPLVLIEILAQISAVGACLASHVRQFEARTEIEFLFTKQFFDSRTK